MSAARDERHYNRLPTTKNDKILLNVKKLEKMNGVHTLKNYAIRYKDLIITFLLVLVGLSRFMFLDNWGIVDSEWWRAWMNHINLVGIANVYSEPINSLSLYKELLNPITLPGNLITFPNIDVPIFNTNEYFRKYFPIAQPPVFLMDLAFTVELKNLLQINSDYVMLNLTNIFFSALLTYILYRIVRENNIDKPLNWALVLIWANPMLILQSNLQGYRDLLLVSLITLGIHFVTKKNKIPYLSGLIFGLALLTKPTAIYLFLPVYLLTSNKDFIKFISGVAATIFSVTAVIALNGRLYGFLAALLTESQIGKNYSEGIGIWTPVYVLEKLPEFFLFSSEFEELLKSLNSFFENKITIFWLIVLLLFALLARGLKKKRIYTIFDVEFQLFAITLLLFLPNIKINHYFVFLPIWLIIFAKQKLRSTSVFILPVFFIQDLIYGGFGRNSIFDGTKFSAPINIVLTILLSICLVKWFFSEKSLGKPTSKSM